MHSPPEAGTPLCQREAMEGEEGAVGRNSIPTHIFIATFHFHSEPRDPDLRKSQTQGTGRLKRTMGEKNDGESTVRMLAS